MKEKVKKFYEEHKVQCVIAGATGLVIIGEIIGWKCCRKFQGCKSAGIFVEANKHINALLLEACDTYGSTGMSGCCIVTDTPIRIDELGKLSEVARLNGFNMNQELTHFIGMGKPLDL